MVNSRSEQHLGRDHGVVIGQEKLSVENATFVGGVLRAGNLNEKVAEVGKGWLSENTLDGVLE